MKLNGHSDFDQQLSVFKTLPWHWHWSPAVATVRCAAECVYKWGTPLWTSVNAGRGLTVNCMCRMGRSRRHNYTNPLLISSSVGKLNRNDARDVASPGNPNKKHSPAQETGSHWSRLPWSRDWRVICFEQCSSRRWSPCCPAPHNTRALAELLALWTVGKAAGPQWLWVVLLSSPCSQYQAM